MNLFKRIIHDQSGFSLTELLVVIVIIGILAALALPKFTTVITRAKSTEAKLMLKQVYQLEHSYFLENDNYTNDLNAIGFEQETLKTEGGTARYKVELAEINGSGFIAAATAVVDFDRDGNFNVWQIDQQGVIKEVQAD